MAEREAATRATVEARPRRVRDAPIIAGDFFSGGLLA